MEQFLSDVAEICELKSGDSNTDTDLWLQLPHQITAVQNQFFGE